MIVRCSHSLPHFHSLIAKWTPSLGLFRTVLNKLWMQESAFLSLFEFKPDLLGHLFGRQSIVATVLPDVDKSLLKFTLGIQFGRVDLNIACKVGGRGFGQIKEASEDGA